MRKILSIMMSMVLAMGISATPAMAMDQEAAVVDDPLGLGAYSPVGQWIDHRGEAKYEVSVCGDGTQLCALLTWMRPDVIKDGNRHLLGTYVLDKAKRTHPAKWEGDIQVYGHTFAGTVTIVSTHQLHVQGCFLILCDKFNLNRIVEDESEVASDSAS